MPSAAAIPARKIRKALGPELVDAFRDLEGDVQSLKTDQAHFILPPIRQQEAATARLRADAQSAAVRLTTLEARPVLPVGLSFWQRLRWLVRGV